MLERKVFDLISTHYTNKEELHRAYFPVLLEVEASLRLANACHANQVEVNILSALKEKLVKSWQKKQAGLFPEYYKKVGGMFDNCPGLPKSAKSFTWLEEQ